MRRGYPAGQVGVLEYDQLIQEKARLLPKLYEFIGLPYKQEYAAPINQLSLSKKDKLNLDERQLVESVCMPVYESALSELTIK